MINIFFKTINFKKKLGKKIDIIFNGKNAGKLLKDIIKYSDVTLVAAPNENQEAFIMRFNTYKTKENKIKADIYNLESENIDIDNYVFLHKDEYANYLKFKKKNERLVSITTQEQIKADSKNLSQRSLAKLYNVSLATINKIINNK